MRLAGRAEIFLDAKVQLDAMATEPAAAARCERGRFGQFLEAQHPAVEVAQCEDVVAGDPFTFSGGALRVPDGPGLGAASIPAMSAGSRAGRAWASASPHRSWPERPDGAGNSFHRRGAEQGQLQDVARHDGDEHAASASAGTLCGRPFCRLVLCTGEAGIGKTRLAEEAAADATAKGVPVAWARAADRDSLPPYGLWRLVLAEPVVRAGDDPSGAGLWSHVFGNAERPRPADSADSGSAQRFALFAEVRRRLAEAARPGGLLLVLDDLQWADEASAVLLADVVRQLRGTPILILATYRESASFDDAAAGLLPRLSADASTERIDLRALPAGAVGDMLLAAGLPASPDQAGEVHSETGGNPFLVRFSVGVVARMLDAPVLALLGPLDECRAAGFLVPGDRPGDHRFSHALVRSAVAARLSATEQRRLHTAAVAGVRGGRAPVPAGAVGRC